MSTFNLQEMQKKDLDELQEQYLFANQLRFQIGSKRGHYESYFFRANDPEQARAIWIRYTIFVPKGRPKDALAELWAVYFDKAQNQVSAAKAELPLSPEQFGSDAISIDIGIARAQAKLGGGILEGEIKAKHKTENTLSWDLRYGTEHSPIFLLPKNLYDKPLPKAKAVIGAPLAKFNGSFVVNGETIVIKNWLGSENHNWGEKHTDQYAWGQVCGFDGAPEVFVEAISGKIKVGPIWSPLVSVLVLRIGEEEYRFNTIKNAFKAKANYDFFCWELKTQQAGIEVSIRIKADRSDFAGLNYYNPPGGSHTCLNSKIASCELKVKQKGKEEKVYFSQYGAAFEILTDLSSHGVELQC